MCILTNFNWPRAESISGKFLTTSSYPCAYSSSTSTNGSSNSTCPSVFKMTESGSQQVSWKARFVARLIV